MKFAKVVFAIAGVWGVLVVTPLYFTRDLIGRQYPPPITHPDFYYGFVSVTLVWQLAFLMIATNPVRYRPMMVVAMLEKFVYIAAMTTLFAQGQLQLGQYGVVGPDFVLGMLFIAACLKCRPGAVVGRAHPAALPRSEQRRIVMRLIVVAAAVLASGLLQPPPDRFAAAGIDDPQRVFTFSFGDAKGRGGSAVNQLSIDIVPCPA
jgi:hypothetical protein